MAEDESTGTGGMSDEEKAELETLRKEKAEAKAAADKAKDEEMAALKKYREDNETAKAKAPKSTKTKEEKAAEAAAETKPETKPDEEKKDDKSKHGASRRWFG